MKKQFDEIPLDENPSFTEEQEEFIYGGDFENSKFKKVKVGKLAYEIFSADGKKVTKHPYKHIYNITYKGNIFIVGKEDRELGLINENGEDLTEFRYINIYEFFGILWGEEGGKLYPFDPRTFIEIGTGLKWDSENIFSLEAANKYLRKSCSDIVVTDFLLDKNVKHML